MSNDDLTAFREEMRKRGVYTKQYRPRSRAERTMLIRLTPNE